MTLARATVLALAVAGALLGSPARAQTQDKPAPDAKAQPPAGQPTAPAPASASPPAGYPYPAPYGYPPGYGFPPGYTYPSAPYPAYPPQGYPQYPPAYPAYPPPYPTPAPEPPPEPPAPLPSGRWRMGASLFLVPQGYLSYDLKYRGESQLTYAGGTTATAGVTTFAELDPIRHLYLGLALQFLPSIKWEPRSGSAAGSNAFSGTGQELDLLPQIGASLSASPRLRLLAYVAPGYSLLIASGMADAFANSGTAHGFVVQTGGGVLYALGAHGFFSIRGSYQWTFQNNQVQSNTTGASADAHFRFHFIALHGAGGYWF